MDLAIERNNLTEKQQQWLTHLEAAEARNLSLTEYAKQEELDLQRLYSWKSQLKQKGVFTVPDHSGQFVEAKVSSSLINQGTHQVSILLANGIKLELPVRGQSISALILELSSL